MSCELPTLQRYAATYRQPLRSTTASMLVPQSACHFRLLPAGNKVLPCGASGIASMNGTTAWRRAHSVRYEKSWMQAPAESETPEWGGLPVLSSNSSVEGSGTNEEKGAAPKGWRGLGEWQVCLLFHHFCHLLASLGPLAAWHAVAGIPYFWRQARMRAP